MFQEGKAHVEGDGTSELAYSTSSMFGIDQDTLTHINTVSAELQLIPFWRTVSYHRFAQDKDMVELEKRGGVQGIAQLLGCETGMGLDPNAEGDASIEGRARLFGENRLPPVPPVSFWMLMVSEIHVWCLTLVIF